MSVKWIWLIALLAVFLCCVVGRRRSGQSAFSQDDLDAAAGQLEEDQDEDEIASRLERLKEDDSERLEGSEEESSALDSGSSSSIQYREAVSLPVTYKFALEKEAELEALEEVEHEEKQARLQLKKTFRKYEADVRSDLEQDAKDKFSKLKEKVQQKFFDQRRKVADQEDAKDEVVAEAVQVQKEKIKAIVTTAEKRLKKESKERGVAKPTGLKFLGRGYNPVFGNPVAVRRQTDPGFRTAILEFHWTAHTKITRAQQEASNPPFMQLDFEETPGYPSAKYDSSFNAPPPPDSDDSDESEETKADDATDDSKKTVPVALEPTIYNEAEIPDGIDFFFQPPCSFEPDDVIEVTSKRAMQKELYHSVDLPPEFLASAFTRSRVVAFLSEIPAANSRVAILQRSQCLAYRARVMDDALAGGKITLTESFLYYLKEALKNGDWNDFITQYGLTYVHDMDGGGVFFAQTKSSVKLLYCLGQKKIGESFALALPAKSVAGNMTEAESHLQALGRTRVIYKGGRRQKDVNWEWWQKDLWRRYFPVNIVVRPIWDLFNFPILFANHIPGDLKIVQSKVKKVMTAYLARAGRAPPDDRPPPYHEIDCNKA